MKKQYFLSRLSPSQRYRLEKAPMQGAEVVGPIPTFAEARAEQKRLNAQVVKPPRKRGRPAKEWERFEMKLEIGIHKRLTARAAELGEHMTAVAERILDAGLPK